MNVGQKLRFLREENNMTLEEVSKKLGIAKQTLYKYETGIITNIPLLKIEELAQIYNVTPSYITGWEDSPELDDDIVVLARGAKTLTKEQKQLIRNMIDEFNKNNED